VTGVQTCALPILKDIFTAFEIKSMIVSSIALGALGKFLTNFFKEETSEKE
jgi:hypothetical protein